MVLCKKRWGREYEVGFYIAIRSSSWVSWDKWGICENVIFVRMVYVLKDKSLLFSRLCCFLFDCNDEFVTFFI